jgi:beta-glucanase (GH16 family)
MQHKKHTCGNKTLFYTSGIIKSKAKPIKYGYFEARIKAAPLFPGVCPAFWVYRSENDKWTEIDFVELTEVSRNVRRIDTNLHAFQHPDLYNGERRNPGKHHCERRHWDAPWDPRNDFHVYGCEWDEKRIRWYIDGKVVNEAKNKYWDQPLDVVLSFGVRSPLNRTPSSKGFPTIFEVDYVRVWKKDTPNQMQSICT